MPAVKPSHHIRPSHHRAAGCFRKNPQAARLPAAYACRHGRILALTISLFATLWLCGLASAQERDGSLTPVTLQLRWVPQFQFAGYFMAQENGHYRDAGLDVTIVPMGPDRPAAIEAVVSGQADFGITGSGLILERARGQPVVALAAIFQHSPHAWLCLGDEVAPTLHDLVGKRLMTILPWSESVELVAPFAAEGIPLDSLTFVPTTYQVTALIEGEVDAFDAYITNEPYTLEQQGIPYSLIRPRTYGVDFYGDVLFTSESLLSRDADLVARFREASLKGWHDAMADIAGTARVLHARHASDKSLDHLLFEARAMQDLVEADIVELGYMNPGRWHRIAEVYQDLGLLQGDMSDLSEFLYNPSPPRLSPWTSPTFLGALALIVVSAAAAVLFARFNHRLRLEAADRQAAEAALEARSRDLEDTNSRKDLILGVISHDVRNLFNAIMAPAEMLSLNGDRMERSQIRSYATGIRTAGANALDVLENVLQWVSLEVGASELSREEVDLEKLAVLVAELYATDAAHKGVSLQIRAVPTVATVDRRAIGTILRNLIHNAIKYTDKGGTVVVAVGIQADSVALSVADTGVGMPPDKASGLFKLAQHESASGTRGEIGTGLGLGLCRQMVDAHAGSIVADSAPGRGTTVTVTLPREAVSSEPAPLQPTAG